MGFQDKIRRRAAQAAPPAASAPSDFVPRSLLDDIRRRAAEREKKLDEALRGARGDRDRVLAVMHSIKTITAPATVQNYQGGHAAHVAAVHSKAKAIVAEFGVVAQAPPKREGDPK
jgi:hypothetical protein